jgi:hypothetical protein
MPGYRPTLATLPPYSTGAASISPILELLLTLGRQLQQRLDEWRPSQDTCPSLTNTLPWCSSRPTQCTCWHPLHLQGAANQLQRFSRPAATHEEARLYRTGNGSYRRSVPVVHQPQAGIPSSLPAWATLGTVQHYDLHHKLPILAMSYTMADQ